MNPEEVVRKFPAGLMAALGVSALCAFLVIVWDAYNVAAVAPGTELERIFLNSTMRYFVRAHAGKDTRNGARIRCGKASRTTMLCVSSATMHLAKNAAILAKASRQWSSAQLFWIIKNGIKMTGMPAFGI
jgi:hypothetical protein